MSLHDDLHRALRPVDPGPEFTARVLAAIDAGARPEQAPAFRRRWARRSWMWPALAASLVGAVVGVRWFEVQREVERGEAARAQVMQALRLTSEKLHVAREVVAESSERRSASERAPR